MVSQLVLEGDLIQPSKDSSLSHIEQLDCALKEHFASKFSVWNAALELALLGIDENELI